MKLTLSRFECARVEGRDGKGNFTVELVFVDQEGEVVIFAIFFSYTQVVRFVRRHKFEPGEKRNVLSLVRRARHEGLPVRSKYRAQFLNGLAAQAIYLQTPGPDEPEIEVELVPDEVQVGPDHALDWYSPELEGLRAEFWSLIAQEASH